MTNAPVETPPPPSAVKTSPLKGLATAFTPNAKPGRHWLRLIALIEAGIALLLWIVSPWKVLPNPAEVFRALGPLWQQGLGANLDASIRLNLEALLWSTFIALLVAYLSVIPVFRPIGTALSKGRFLSMMGISFVFMLITGGGHGLKVWMLTFGIVVFYVTGTLEVVASLPKEQFDYARTLRMKEWRVVLEVVVLGTLPAMLEVLRQSAAIGWMMLTMVEGIVRSEGGVGAMLLNESKHFRLAEVFAIQLVILVIGLCQDEIIAFLGRFLFPYAHLQKERA